MSREGKIHLVECCSFPRATYKNVTNDEHFKSLKEAAQNIHKKSRLTEATTILKAKKILNEAKIDEDVQKRVLESLQEAGANLDDIEIWQFPISRINTTEDPNLNGRVYGLPLWNKVVNDQRDVWQGGTGLANHPADDEDGDFMNQSIVWLDGFVGDDNYVYGIGTFVGAGGALARQIISVGGRVGFSTSGYGDFLRDGITVDPDSYEIDRFADLVLNPSQGVYGDYKDVYHTQHESVKKAVSKGLKESKTMKRNLKESTDIKSIIKAAEADDAVEQLSKIADTEKVTINLSEGIATDIGMELGVKLVANVIKGWKKDDCTPDNLQDVKDALATFVKDGATEDDVKAAFEDALNDADVAEDVINVVLGKEEIQEDTEIEEDADKPAEKDAEKDSTETEEDETKDSDEDAEEDEDEKVEEEIDLDETSDMPLEDQLIVEHYSKTLRAIGKKPAELWEEKINDLDKLSTKLNEAKLSRAAKSALNEKTDKLVNSIMKESRAAILEGIKAKKICEELGINTIAKLSNVKDKLEDYVSLEACLEKATKEANKYKALYEAKSTYAQSEAEDSYSKDETISTLNEEILTLKKQLTEAQADTKAAKKAGIATKIESVKADKATLELKEEQKQLGRKYNRLVTKYEEMIKTLEESEKTILALKRERSQILRESNGYKEQIKQMSHSLLESKAANKELKATKNALSRKNKELNSNLTSIHESEKSKQFKAKLEESKARRNAQQKLDEFYDSDKMFRNSKDINNFLEGVGVKDKSAFKGVKTLREAEDKYLFSNELLNEEADNARDQIDVPTDSVQSLSDLFRED